MAQPLRSANTGTFPSQLLSTGTEPIYLGISGLELGRLELGWLEFSWLELSWLELGWLEFRLLGSIN